MDNFSSLPLILYAGNYNGRNYGKYNGKLHFHDGMELVFIKCGSCINRTPEGEYPSRAGDLLVIHDAGAHGLAMGYNYNGKLRCAEVLLQPDGSTRLIRRAETPEDYFATMIWDD